ncbi:uncharacterized protein LOC113560626 [Rhopalosiphum maidis]|uniref:uncharacterized protein LOC113560626 n=1 Tax=Rhopalosiphum maidis TaxID=43146 RepID=UPI000EFED408|nr:uncharacterized protein LOC113560626 [Rhopalosiphum maidis]
MVSAVSGRKLNLDNYRRDYVCHIKNLNCLAKIKIVIKKTTVNTIKKDHFIKEGLVAEISLHTIHAHILKSAEALSNLKIFDEVRKEFENYFNDGLGISDAIIYHECKLELEGDESILANASLNPKYRIVQYLHDIWWKTNLGPRIGNGVIE